ncbi:alginate lyase [Pseudosporangium ferrugineum]|uniref:Alginate lyase n=1 Tax=Pseudosporangium ferrugineum TaxID=439699 RepID=A0A2T0SI35_9ACTN|nr:alginate lyase [Pseudosporangium ferrugineum]
MLAAGTAALALVVTLGVRSAADAGTLTPDAAPGNSAPGNSTATRNNAGLAGTVQAGAAQARSATAGAGTARAAAVFSHPGVLLSRAQLDFVKGRVAARAQPWLGAYDQMMASRYASLSRTPKPRATVECGSYSNPDNGCTDEREDAIAAYTDALAWYITGNSAYAQKSIALMDAWSATIRNHTNSNAPLQTAWAGSVWPRAAEIIRHAYGNWPNQERFATMLRTVYLPVVIPGIHSNGNWELSMMEAAVGISVHLDDRASYDRAIARFKLRAASYVYLAADGSQPKYPPAGGIDTRAELIDYWQGQSTFVDGLAQETCRDFTHTGYGISAIAHVAETTRIQGADLYPELQDRLRHALGFHTKFENGAAVPSTICGGTVTRGLGPVTEVAYHALHDRMGIAMSNTEVYTVAKRPQGSNNLFVAWETLTHAGNPA